MSTLVSKLAMTEAIMAAKASKDVTWEQIADATGMSTVYITSCCLGMNSTPADAAKKLCDYLDLGSDITSALEVYPKKVWDQAVPTDPLIYRFYEATGVYGDTLKRSSMKNLVMAS